MDTKKLLIVICILANQLFNTVNAQAPQSFNYQAVARDASGAVLSNQAVSFRISLLQGSSTGTNVYSETHTVTTNQFGLVNFAIGGGILVSGSFANIDWAQGPYFVQVELDASGGSTYVIMNTTQLLSVPYTLYAEKSGNPTLIAGSGIAISNDTIINIEPDQTVTIIGAGITNVTGNYPNFTVNTASYTAGTGINITGQNITAQNTNPIWNANQIQNIPIDSTPPVIGNSLVYNGSNWVFSGQVFSHYVGEVFGGGIIYELWKDSQGIEHGLIVGLNDISINSPWGLFGINVVNCESSWNGLANTNEIIINGSQTGDAAFICNDLVSNSMLDWYLPSVHEFNALWKNLYSINKVLSSLSNASEIPLKTYWTSTEEDSQNAWVFGVNGPTYIPKNLLHSVRPIRTF